MDRVRDLIPYIFWPWFATSCFILLRRRVTHGSWKALSAQEKLEQQKAEQRDFPPPPPTEIAEPATSVAPAGSTDPGTTPFESSVPAAESHAHQDPRPEPVRETSHAQASVAPGSVDTMRTRARSLAEAVEGITMPCDLAPLMGKGHLDPREVAFFATGHHPGAIGAALAGELERLGYRLTPLDDRSIKAERDSDVVEIRLVSAELTSEAVMRDKHPSAPADAVVAELKLT